MELDLLKKIGLALALGVLVGIEREFSQRREGEPLFAGSRTFALLALLGAISGYLAEQISALLLLGVLLVVGALILMSYILSVRTGGHLGTTTEVSALLTFLIGVIVVRGELLVASITTIAVVTFLALKPGFKAFTGKISHEDIYATLKFAIITVVILPFLPNRTIGPLGVFNPTETWWMVILVSGISFAGYVLVKIIGAHRSVPLIGLVGGLASSTAVTVSFSQRSKQNAGLSRVLALGAVLASTTMFPRLMIELAVVNSTLLSHVWMPLSGMALAGLLGVGWLWRMERRQEHTAEVQFTNPFSISPALKFALLFVVILFASKAALDFIGTRALYFTAVVAGLTDVDAIALTTARLARESLDTPTATAAVILAAMSNTVMKGGIALLFGARIFGRQMALAFGLILLAGALGLLLA
ncbi:MAG: MgtC/SapB family protein [candidate division KSB1 bacterium]|nr:MgtC/SapB family protein [candidate division KSB1 bacterium]MDZ7301572.1 MgtC/SapB family protein [candidate division KSB1 bacterium]MDZ7311012.1 MgtC/SapB family protein [candidate division KSB1 bacterium]